MITETRIREEMEATDGPAHVRSTYIVDTTQALYRIDLGGFVTIDPNGIRGSDLLAAKNAFEEILLALMAKYPYTAP